MCETDRCFVCVCESTCSITQTLFYRQKFREFVVVRKGREKDFAGMVRDFTMRKSPGLSTWTQCCHVCLHRGRKDFWESGAEQVTTADSSVERGPWAQRLQCLARGQRDTLFKSLKSSLPRKSMSKKSVRWLFKSVCYIQKAITVLLRCVKRGRLNGTK